MTTGSPIYLVSACASAEEFVAAFRRYADRTGLFVPIAEPLAVGKRVWVAIALNGGGVMIEGVAEIIQSSAKPSALHGRIGMTLRFVEPDAPSKIVLAELEKARLAMKPAPCTVPPRPASIPAEPRATPPALGGRIDAANALAESVAIGDLAGLRLSEAAPKAGQKFVVPAIPAVDRSKSPSRPPEITPTTIGIIAPVDKPAAEVRSAKSTSIGMPLLRPRVTETQPAPVVPPPRNPTPIEPRPDAPPMAAPRPDAPPMTAPKPLAVAEARAAAAAAEPKSPDPEAAVIANKPVRDDPAPRRKSATAPPRYPTPVAPLPIVRPPAYAAPPPPAPQAPLEDHAEKTDLSQVPEVAPPIDSGKAYVGPPPKPAASSGMRASEIMAAVSADDDWTMTPDAPAPTVVAPPDKPGPHVVESQLAQQGPPTGDWTITNDPSGGWTAPAKVERKSPVPAKLERPSPAPPSVPVSGNVVEPVAAEKVLQAWEDKPTSIGAKIEIDPTLMEEPIQPAAASSGQMPAYPSHGSGAMPIYAPPEMPSHGSGAMPIYPPGHIPTPVPGFVPAGYPPPLAFAPQQQHGFAPQQFVAPPNELGPQPGLLPPPQGFIPPPSEFGAPPQGFVPPPSEFGPPPQGFVPPPNEFGPGFVPPPNEFGPGFVPPPNEFGPGFVPPPNEPQGFVPPNEAQGFPHHDPSGPQPGFAPQQHGFGMPPPNAFAGPPSLSFTGPPPQSFEGSADPSNGAPGDRRPAPPPLPGVAPVGGLFAPPGAQPMPPTFASPPPMTGMYTQSPQRMDPTDGGTGFFYESGQVPRYPTDAALAAIGDRSRRRLIMIIGGALGAALILVLLVVLLGGKKHEGAKGDHAAKTAGSDSVASGSAMAAGSAVTATAGSAGSDVGSAAPMVQPAIDAGAVTPATCNVEVTSVPAGADVLIDDTNVLGTTPGTFPLPCNAPVKLTIRKQRYATVVKDFTPTPDAESLKVTLPRTSFSIKVTSSPAGSTITVGGRVLGVTPTTIKLPAFESSTITFTKDGYSADAEKISVKANNQLFHATLKKGSHPKLR